MGGQFGSEGKGKISAVITLQEQIDLCIRCGGPNSGHSFQNENGELILVRQLPTGFVRPQTRLLIPAGGLVNLAILRSEIEMLGLDAQRVGVDRNAMIISDMDTERERTLGLGERLSSTLCGVGSAVARRVLRGADVELASTAAEKHGWLRPLITDVSEEANRAVDLGKNVLIEGTQGSGLSLYHSPHYPKTTSRDTNAAAFVSEVGLSPRLVSEVVLVFRTFPIRVAGSQAGPLRDEITWEQLQTESGSLTPLHEYTSVTRKLRRLGRFDWEAARRAVMLNRPTRLALNFADYFSIENRNASRLDDLNRGAREFIHLLEALHVPISYIGTGPQLSQTILQEPPRGSPPQIRPMYNAFPAGPANSPANGEAAWGGD